MRRLNIILLTTLVLVGCQSQPLQPTLFDTSPCKAPCWENVTPGVTTKEDALKIFAKFADKEGVLDRPSEFPYYEDDIRFGPNSETSVFVSTFNGKVSEMMFSDYSHSLLSLQRAVGLFGEPESVLIEGGGAEYYKVTLFSPSKGVAIGWFITGFAALEISADAKVSLISFFDPSQFDRLLNARSNGHGNEVKQQLHPWTGYGDIKEKYWPPLNLP